MLVSLSKSGQPAGHTTGEAAGAAGADAAAGLPSAATSGACHTSDNIQAKDTVRIMAGLPNRKGA
jgi:hypothetical protein